MDPRDLPLLLVAVAWSCAAVAIAASEVLKWRLLRAFRQRHPERYGALRGPAARRHFFMTGEHLRMGDPVLDARAERLRIVDIVAVGLFFGGFFVVVVNSVVAWAGRG